MQLNWAIRAWEYSSTASAKFELNRNSSFVILNLDVCLHTGVVGNPEAVYRILCEFLHCS